MSSWQNETENNNGTKIETGKDGRNSSSKPKEANINGTKNSNTNETNSKLDSTTTEKPLKAKHNSSLDDPKVGKNETKANETIGKNSTDFPTDYVHKNGNNTIKLF